MELNNENQNNSVQRRSLEPKESNQPGSENVAANGTEAEVVDKEDENLTDREKNYCAGICAVLGLFLVIYLVTSISNKREQDAICVGLVAGAAYYNEDSDTKIVLRTDEWEEGTRGSGFAKISSGTPKAEFTVGNSETKIGSYLVVAGDEPDDCKNCEDLEVPVCNVSVKVWAI